MTSIFSEIFELFEFHQRKGWTPKEDFFTKTLVAVVNRSNLFRDEFVRWLFEPFELEPENIQRPPEIVPHKFFNFDNGVRFPDICVEVRDIENNSYVAIIESKIDSRQRENQLNDYRNILVQKWPDDWSKTLVYITKYNENVNDYQGCNNIVFTQHLWSNLYNRLAIAKQIRPNKVGDLEHGLLTLMEDWQMNGNIKPAHLRSLITCVNTGVGERLAEIQDQAWYDSGLDDVWENTRTQGRWNYSEKWQGGQYSNENLTYGIRIWMGFRHDRRDPGWNVDDREIPCPAVSLARVGDANNMFPQPVNWTNPDGIEFFSGELWVRQPTQEEIQGIPNYGEPLRDYYNTFFMTAFTEFIAATNMIP